MESLRHAITIMSDETADKINVAASEVDRLESELSGIQSQLTDAEQEKAQCEETLSTLDDFSATLDRCPYCLTLRHAEILLTENEGADGERYQYCTECQREFSN